MLGAGDRQESEEDVKRAVDLLRIAHGKFMKLEELSAPAPGSILHAERRFTAYEPLDIIVSRQRTRAVDNLGRVFDLMFDDQQAQMLAYPYSLYSLVRAAIESAALALWLLKPQTKAARVLRSLQLTYRDTYERLQFVELIATEQEIAAERTRHDRIEARLIQLKDSVGALKQRTLGRPPKYGAILEAVSERATRNGRTQYDLMSPLMVWKISTAFIHGSSQVTQALSDLRQLTEFEDGIAGIEVTPTLGILAGTIHVTVDLIDRVDQRYTDLATHDYGGTVVA